MPESNDASKAKSRRSTVGGASRIFDKLRAQPKSSKLQTPKKRQAQSSKTDLRAVCPGIFSLGLWLEIWNFSGAWGLLLGVSLGRGSKTEAARLSCFDQAPWPPATGG
jgi:hypothetical protein